MNIRKSGAVLALLLVACDEPPRGPEFRVATDPPTPRIEPPIEAGAPRFRVTFAQFFHDELAYGKERGVYVLTDARDGREYVLVTGCCVAELCAHPIGRSTAPDER